MKRRWIYGAGIVLAAVLAVRLAALLGRGGQEGHGRPGRTPVAVEIAEVRRGPIADVRSFTGSVHAQYQYVIAPKVSGRIVAVNERIGDAVARGEVVARIDDAEYQQALREAEANLRIAQASQAEAQSQLALAQQELERAQSLSEKGIASVAELDAATTGFAAQQSRLKLANAQVEQRQAALQVAQIQLGHTVLVASEPGFVGERYVDEGALMAPGAPVLLIVGIQRVTVRSTVVEREYGLIQPGQRAWVSVDALPERRFAGEVVRIAPMLQEASRTAQMEIEVANDSLALKPGMFARVAVVLAARENAQLVPAPALVAHDGGAGIFVVDRAAAVARFVPVTVGISTPDVVEILAPEIRGPVVTLGQHLLADASPVLLPAAAPSAPADPR